MLLEKGLSLYDEAWSSTYASPSRNTLGLLSLAMNETVSFQNLIDPSIFQEVVRLHEIWRNSQKERVARLKNENETKTEETTAWLKKTHKNGGRRSQILCSILSETVSWRNLWRTWGSIHTQLQPNVDWRGPPRR